MLPNAALATVEPAKVRDYLLSAQHPVGRFKAVVFASMGYHADDWMALRDDLLVLARQGNATAGRPSAHGQKFEVSGSLHGPNGRNSRITSVWMVDAFGDAPRFITAFPA